MTLVILFCEKCAEKCQSVRKRVWFRNWFAGHIDPGSIERSWNSRVIADSYYWDLGLGDSRRCILVGHSRKLLR